jgi:hypothetical protein
MKVILTKPSVGHSQKTISAARPRRPLNADTIAFLLRTSIDREKTTNRAAYIEINSVSLHNIIRGRGRKLLGVTVIRTYSDLEQHSDTIAYEIDLENGSVSVFSKKAGDTPFTETRKNFLVEQLEWLIGKREDFKKISIGKSCDIHQERLFIDFDKREANSRKLQPIYRNVAKLIAWLKRAGN